MPPVTPKLSSNLKASSGSAPSALARPLGGALLALVLSGCGGVTAFQGAAPITIAGTPPPAPPPKAVAPPPRVEVKKNEIVINEKVQFEVDKATILPVSHGLLDEVATTIKQNPQITKLEIQGHASSEGSADHNLKVSDERAKAVMAYLVSKGVPAAKLSAKGYGSTVPIADNGTEEGREKNRRVQFVIIDKAAEKKAP